MFNDDNFGLFATIFTSTIAFLVGRDMGEKKVKAELEAQTIINNQNFQIAVLNNKINELTRRYNEGI
jgi:uncharacterized membrane protein YdjX (TVP38/TMEM64 family)